MADPELIDRKAVRLLAEARGIRSATIFGQPGGWSIRIRYGDVQRAIGLQSAGAPRVWRTLLIAVSYVRDELGLLRFEVDMTERKAGATPRRRRDLAEHDRGARTEAGVADPDLPSDAEVRREVRRRLALEKWQAKTKH